MRKMLNTARDRDHVPEVERQIKAMKERMWEHHANLPFPSFTRRMTIDLVKHVVMLINTFPPKRGISTTYSHLKITTGKTLDWKILCKLIFDAYAQVNEYRNITNTMKERTQGAIYIGPTENVQVAYNFLLLRTRKKITRGKFTKVLKPTTVMKRLAAVALE